DVSDDEDDERDVGQDHPPPDVPGGHRFHCYRLGFTCDGPRSRLTLNAEPIQRYTVTVYEHTIRTDHIRAHP
ncbi:hypothetical protein, partial [Mycobacterium kyorinense]|uniref:hypothetical protein n=1 Tax=Mycobacterium kyorinense TaxID=487514 RepID=UPI001B809D9C